MKLILLAAAVTIFATGSALGQGVKRNNKLEQEIRRLDLAEADAIQRNDFTALSKLLAKDFTVNSPRNNVVNGREELFTLMRKGITNYSSFVREPEVVLIHGDTAIVMGAETIKPTGNAPGAGQTLRRRYTNVWMRRNGKWLLTGRQASIICPS
jgi:ketosteroid isomerase-like protein